jgi:DHA1 family bicyclomycin/chloramphenicol resistance-like MFS transporter
MIAHLKISRGRLAFILGALAMLGPFSIDTVFPAFAVMESELGVGKMAMQQTISVYLLGYAAMSLVHGPLSDALGRRPVILVGVAVFALASVGCALAPSLPILLAFRAVQGLSAGVGLIVGRAVVRDALQGDDAQRLMSNISMIFGVAPAIAPIVGGWVLGWRDWQSIFWFLTAFALLLMVATMVALPESHPPEKRLPLNARVLASGYREILGNGGFRLLALAGTANFGALFLYITSAPAFVLDMLKLNEQQFGWFFAPTIGGMILGAFVSGRSAGRLSGVRLANIGFLFCAISAVGNIGYNWLVPVPMLPWAVLPTVFSAFGIALVFPILTITILDMYPNMRGSASSMQAFVGLLSNSLIAGVLSPMLSDKPMKLALGAAGFTTVAWLLWRWYLAHAGRVTVVGPEDEAELEAASMEPTSEM